MRSRLYRRGKIWWAWFYDADGKQRCFSTRCIDRKAAEIALRERERRAADPAHAAAHETTIDVAFKRLFVDRENQGRSDGTVSMYRSKAGHVVRVMGGETPLARVTPTAVDKYIEQRLAEGAHRNSVHKELTTIRAMLKVAK